MSKIIETSISPNYVPDWHIGEAIREIIQNTIDEDGYIEYERGGILTLTTENGRIPTSMLALGNSGKRGDNSKIGRHGDGLKTALAVILREGYDIVIQNGGLIWQPKIDTHSTLGCDCVVIEETDTGEVSDTVEITISGIARVIDEVTDMSLQLDQEINGLELETADCEYGEVIFNDELQGKIYVNGLYITSDNNLKYAFNFNPEYVSLDRDRKAINYYEMLSLIARVIVHSNDTTAIVECLYDENALEHREIVDELYSADQSVKDEIVDDYCLTKTRRKTPISKSGNTQVSYENVICLDEDRMKYLETHQEIMDESFVYIVERNRDLKDFINNASDNDGIKDKHLNFIETNFLAWQTKAEKIPYQLELFNKSTYKKSVALVNRLKKHKGIRKADIDFLVENLVKKAPTNMFGEVIKEIDLDCVNDDDYVLEITK